MLSVLGIDSGYAVKYTPSPSGVPSAFALENSFRRRGIFDRVSGDDQIVIIFVLYFPRGRIFPYLSVHPPDTLLTPSWLPPDSTFTWQLSRLPPSSHLYCPVNNDWFQGCCGRETTRKLPEVREHVEPSVDKCPDASSLTKRCSDWWCVVLLHWGPGRSLRPEM